MPASNPGPAASKPPAGYSVTPLGALAVCSAAFGAAVLAVSAFTYRRNLSRLKAEGFSDDDVQRAMPYAAQALGIATACVGGVGLFGTGVVYASGADLKQHAEVSSFKDAWGMLAGREFGQALGRTLKDVGEKHWGEWKLQQAGEVRRGANEDEQSGL